MPMPHQSLIKCESICIVLRMVFLEKIVQFEVTKNKAFTLSKALVNSSYI